MEKNPFPNNALHELIEVKPYIQPKGDIARDSVISGFYLLNSFAIVLC